MGYTKQNFKDFDKPLTAAQLEKMEDGILEAIQTAENADAFPDSLLREVSWHPE